MIYAVMVLGIVISTGLFHDVSAQDKEKQEKGPAWFDMDHCAICKNLASMKNDIPKIKSDTQMLDNGIIMISVVPRKMREAMEQAEKGMQATIEELESGKPLELCGFCQNYGNLMQMGANFKEIETVGVNLTLITSSDPEVVKKIQAFGKQSVVEHDKMVAKIKADSGTKENE
jgi:hypothetical protein